VAPRETFITNFQGLFVHAARSTWNDFKNDRGEDVKGGERTIVTMLRNPHDPDNAAVVNLRVQDAGLGREVGQLGFGVEIAADVEVSTYRGNLRYDVLSIKAAAKA